MIVIGVDTHKRSYAFAAVGAATGELRSSETVKATSAGHERMLAWARELDLERVWAIEDCRHVPGRFEQALIAVGERVIRIPPAVTSTVRRAARAAGSPIRSTPPQLPGRRSEKALRAFRRPSWTSGRWTSVFCATTATSSSQSECA